jgi:8-oxo-dGTP diphosphatase
MTPFTYEYPRPAVTADVVVFARGAADLLVLLIERKHDPFKGAWALPGGFVDADESLGDAALRELREETGVTGLTLTQVGAFGDPGRDPRGHTVTVAFVTVTDPATKVSAGDDAARAEWHAWSTLRLPGSSGQVPLAFDHDRILLAARRKLDGLVAP